MKPKPKKKTVTAWAWTWFGDRSMLSGVSTRPLAVLAKIDRRTDMDEGLRCGPIVKIELPLPKESKR